MYPMLFFHCLYQYTEPGRREIPVFMHINITYIELVTYSIAELCF